MTPTCGLPAVLAALSGQPVDLHPHVTEPPAELAAPVPTPPAKGKTVYGSNFANHVDGTNFTVQWSGSNGDEPTAAAALDALEAAWSKLVVEDGWPQPVSSDTYYLWVLLDRSLGGTTGYTTVYTTPDYPQGYPVIYLNPDYSWDDDFWQSLAAHEFGHTLQFRLRVESVGGDEESWYWEASSEWQAETVLPLNDSYAAQAQYYCDAPGARYSSMEGYHQYGMFPLNAWLEQQGPGALTLRDTWLLGEQRVGEDWDGILEEATGLDAATLWGGFTGAFGNDTLEDSALYCDPDDRGAVSDGASGTLLYLGTDYWQADGNVEVTATGDVALAGPEGHGPSVVLDAGDTLTVTGLADPFAEYTLSVGPPGLPEDTGPPGGGPGGLPDTDAPDTDSGWEPLDSDEPGVQDTGEGEAKGGCACAGAAPSGAWVAVALLALVRRRPSHPQSRGRLPSMRLAAPTAGGVHATSSPSTQASHT